MTFIESLSLCMAGYIARMVVPELQRIDRELAAMDMPEGQRKIILRRHFDNACEEMTRTWVTAEKLLADNKNSRLDFSVHCEFGPEARKPHVSAWEQTKGELATKERNGQAMKHEVKR
jgi:hypothetical protein